MKWKNKDHIKAKNIILDSTKFKNKYLTSFNIIEKVQFIRAYLIPNITVSSGQNNVIEEKQ